MNINDEQQPDEQQPDEQQINYILLNCTNAKKLYNYLKDFNNYIFYDDMVTIKKNKAKILTDFFKFVGKALISKMGTKSIGKFGTKSIGKIGTKSIGKLDINKFRSFLKGGFNPLLSSITESQTVKSACTYFASIAADTNKIKSSQFTQIKELGKILLDFGKKKNLEVFKYLGEIFTNEKIIKKLGKKILVNTVCDDPINTFEALVLRDPIAIAQMGISASLETLEQLQVYLEEKYAKQYENFNEGIMPKSKKKCRIKCKLITSSSQDEYCIYKFDKETGHIEIYEFGDKNKENNIDVNNIAVAKTQEHSNIDYSNIHNYLISNISDIGYKCN